MIKELLSLNDIEKLNSELIDIHGHDLADDFLSLSEDDKILCINLLNSINLSDLVSYLPLEDSVKILDHLNDNTKIINMINEMAVDDAVDLLQEYENPNKDYIIQNLKYAKKVKDLINYKDDEVGAYMTSEFILLNKDWDVKKASKELIKNAELSEDITTLYVVDSNNKFLGSIPLRKLVKAQMPKLVSDLIENDVLPVLNTSNVEIAVDDLKNYNLYSIPVVDMSNNLLGILTLDDVIDIFEDESDEDLLKLASLPASIEISRKRDILYTALKRIPWLLILVLLNIPNTMLANSFASTLAGISIIVILEPLMLSSAGNVATQTLALTLIELSKEGKIKFKAFYKEAASGFYTALSMSIFSFIMSFLITFIFFKITNSSMPTNNNFTSFKPEIILLVFSSIVSISIFIIILFAPIVGMIVPMFFKLIKIDPAYASGPFITTTFDIVSVGIYFSIANIMLKVVGMI